MRTSQNEPNQVVGIILAIIFVGLVLGAMYLVLAIFQV